jgi:hypothetical protein
MSWNVVVRIDWIVVALEAAGLVYLLFSLMTETTHSPEAGPGLGIFLVGMLGLLLAAAAFALLYLSRGESRVGLVAVSLVLLYPAFVLIAQPAVIGYKNLKSDREESAHGDFKDDRLKQMAAAITANNAEQLKTLLGGQPAPEGLDSAGEDLLTFACFRLRDRQGSLDCVRAILESGIDIRKPRIIDTMPLLHFMLLDSSESSQQVARMMLKMGADPRVIDADAGTTAIRRAGGNLETVQALVAAGADINGVTSDGMSDVVYLTMTRQWDSAIYLVEKGARLDIANEHGVSLDYYLKDWKDGVFGEQVEGWDRLRAAIEKRRK